MANIEQLDDPSTFAERLREMDDAHLAAQNLVQQGAIHALSFLLTYGCNEETASDMLASMRENSIAIRLEAKRRGKPELFADDQTHFH